MSVDLAALSRRSFRAIADLRSYVSTHSMNYAEITIETHRANSSAEDKKKKNQVRDLII